MNASRQELDRLFDRYGIAPIGTGGSDSVEASHGGREGRLTIEALDGEPTLTLAIGEHTTEGQRPRDAVEARAIVRNLLATAGIGADPSFEHMLADLLVKASTVYERCGASKFELSPLRLHPTSYYVGNAVLVHDRPLHVKERLAPHSHDQRAVFDHRHGDSTRFPK